MVDSIRKDVWRSHDLGWELLVAPELLGYLPVLWFTGNEHFPSQSIIPRIE